MMCFRWSAIRLASVVLVAAMASAGCSGPPDVEPSPGEPGISLASPTGGSREDLPVDGFDLCSPFTHWVFLRWAPVTSAPPEPGPGSCRWGGEGITATITDETGASLAEISHDPRYRPGYTGFEHNRYWVTATPATPPYTGHLFLAVGPAQPRRLLHIHVESEAERTRSPQPNTSYTPPGLARLIVGCIGIRMTERRPATAAPAPG